MKQPCFSFLEVFGNLQFVLRLNMSVALASGISHSPVTPQQLSLPPVRGQGVSGPVAGQVRRGWRVLFTSSLLMCGLDCFN